MSIGHQDGGRPFKPSGKGGGSKKGKPQAEWPWLLKIVAHAIVIQAKGTSDSWKTDRSMRISARDFSLRMEQLTPGWRSYMERRNGLRKTEWATLLLNRVYKMYYFGTSSDRGKHDPMTRATESDEHWTKHYASDSEYGRLHEDIVRGRITTVRLMTVAPWESFIARIEG